MKVYILRDDVCMKFSCCRMPYCVLVTGFVLGLLVILLLLLGSASALENPVGPSAGGNRGPLTTPSPTRVGNAWNNPPSQPDIRREPHVVVTGRYARKELPPMGRGRFPRHVILYGSAIVGHVFACINSAVLSICAICWPKEERIFAPATYSLLGRQKASA